MVTQSDFNSSSLHSGGNSTRILVVDDEPDLRTLYELTLLREGYRVEAAGDLREARAALDAAEFDVVITDMRLPDGLGMDLLTQLKATQRPERCVVITAYGSAENAVEALKAGAFDYLTKPVDLKQFRSVILSAAKARAGATVDAPSPAPKAAGNNSFRSADARRLDVSRGDAALAQMIGDSAVMKAVRERIAKVARSMAPVLVRGESGTGKELAARALHANSHRAAGPLVAVNCSAIPENLLEAEFFGVKKGAFTGATQDRQGFFQAASSGTLFLDEIGDLPLIMQSKLLRAIQERCVRPLGGTAEESVDVRVVSATHKDLSHEVSTGRFRQDLYYRLNVIEIQMAPVRERLSDLPALCRALLKRIAAEAAIPVPVLSADMLLHLAQLPLHGNVRELENLLHRAVAMSDGDALQIDAVVGFDNLGEQTMPAPLSSDFAPTGSAPLAREVSARTRIPTDLQGHLDQHEREILLRALQETRFNRTAAAARLGISLRQMRYRIARLNIDVPQGHEASDESA